MRAAELMLKATTIIIKGVAWYKALEVLFKAGSK